MPTLTQSDYAKGKLAQAFPSEAGEVMTCRATISLAANPTAADIFEMLAIPAGCRLVDAIVDFDDCDTHVSPELAFDVGFMSGTYGNPDSARTVGAEVFAAAAIGQTAGLLRPTLKTAVRDAGSATERGLGLKCTTDAATFAAGTIGLTAFYVAI